MNGVPQAEIGSRRGLFLNSLGIFASRVLTTLVAFICIPIVVGKLGLAGFGTWESIVAVSLLCNILQTTVSGTVLWLVSNAYGSRDIGSVRRYTRMAVGSALLLTAVITPLAWAGRHFLVSLFHVPSEYAATAAWIFPCVVGLMLLGSINEIVVALIGGFQRAGLAVMIQAGSIVLNNAVVITGLALGAGFWSLLAGLTAQFLVSGIALYLAAVRIVGPVNLIPRFPSRALVIKVAPYAGFLLLGALSIAFRDQADKVILSSVASPVWTGYYGIAARLAGLVPIACTFFYVPTIAASGALFASDDGPGIHRIYNDVIVATSFLAGLVVVLVAGLHDRLIFLWMGKPIPEAGGILYLLLIGHTTAVLLTGTGSSVCKGMGIVKVETVYIIIGLILNVLLKITLVPLLGAIGTVISSSASWAVSSLVFVIVLHRQTRLPASGTVKAAKTLLNILVCVAIARVLSRALPVEPSRLSVALSTVGLAALSTLIFTAMMAASGVVGREDIRGWTGSSGRGFGEDPPMVEARLDRRIVMFPLWFFQAYLAFTVFLFAAGPWPWPVPDPLLLYGFLFLAQWSLWFGYETASGIRPGGYRGPWTAVGLIKVSLVLNLAWILPNYALRMGRRPGGLTDIVGSIYSGLVNPAANYLARNQALAEPRKGDLIAYASLLLYPVLWLLVPLAVLYWRRLSGPVRILTVFFIAADLLSWVAIGTNKGIADFVLLLPWLLLAANPGVIRAITGKRAMKIAGMSIAGLALLLAFFAVGQKGRGGGAIPTWNPYLSIGIDKDNWMIRRLKPEGQAVVAAVTSYLGQGYSALSLALEEPFVWSYGAGNSFYLTSLVERFAGKDTVSDRTYPARIEKAGINRYVNWHTFYSWIASDASFPGTLVVMFLIGRLLAMTWIDVLNRLNPFAPALFALLVIMLFYVPANNQVLGYATTANPFWAILIVWALTRKRYRLSGVPVTETK